MKKIFNQILTAFALCILITSCGGGSRGNYDYNSEDTIPLDYAEATDNATEEVALQQKLAEIKNMPELQNYKGLYKVTDEDGDTFDIYFTQDDAVIITSGAGEVYYCTYNDYTNIDSGIYISPSEGEFSIKFKGGTELIKNYTQMEIKGDWLYASTDYADANNPNWRLPLTVEKAFNSKKSSSSSNSTTTIKSTTKEEIDNYVDKVKEAADKARKAANL